MTARKTKQRDTAANSSFDAMLDKLRLYRETRDPALRDELICQHMPLVYSVAYRYQHFAEPLDDIIQEGSVGLLKAVDHFDPDRGVRFSTYAVHLITSHILHYMRDCGHLIRQPAWVQELNSKITRATRALTQRLNREPSPAEIAEEMGLAEESVKEVLAARELNHIVSLTAPGEGGEEDALLLIDRKKIHQSRHETLRLPIEDRIVLEEAIARLRQLEQQVLRLFFYSDLTLSEISRQLSISTPRSAYLLRSSINKIKADIEEQSANTSAPLVPVPSEGVEVPVYDRLTGLNSGPYLYRRLETLCRDTSTDGTQFAVLLLCIDALPDENDNATMLAGVAQTLGQGIHGTDLAAYLGHNIFGVVLIHVDIQTQVVADRLCDALCQRAGQYHTGRDDSLVAAGFALYPGEATTPQALLARAEQALARAAKTLRQHQKKRREAQYT